MKSLLIFIKSLFYCALITVVLALTAITLGHCDDRDFVDVRELSIGVKQFLPGNFDPLVTQNGIADRDMDQEIGLTLNCDFLNGFYFNNYVHGASDRTRSTGESGQFRAIGYQFKTGVHLTRNIDIGLHHHSQHILDSTYAGGHFPLQNAVELKLNLIVPRFRGESLF